MLALISLKEEFLEIITIVIITQKCKPVYFIAINVKRKTLQIGKHELEI